MASASGTSLAPMRRRPGLKPPRPLGMGPRQPRQARRDASSLQAVRIGANGELGGVMDIQRARLVATTGHLACERGAANVTVAHIVERAGVSRRTFYELFDDAQDAVQCALEDALASAAKRVSPAWHSQGSWSGRLRDSLTGLLGLFDEEPTLARLLVVESLGAGHCVLQARFGVITKLIDAVAQGAGKQSARGTGAARLTAEGAVGGVLAILHERICQPAPAQPLIELTGPLMSMLVLPYQGAAAARREADRPIPARNVERAKSANAAPLISDPFKAAGMRLTYRTMCVLEAIAEHPDRSNREVGELAQITDQGQISKLLARLEQIGMVVNRGRGHVHGEPNAWTLTPAGRQVAETYTSYGSTGGSRRDSQSMELK